MERWQKVVLTVLAVITVVFASFTVGFTLGSGEEGVLPFTSGDEGDVELIEDAYEKILSSAVDPPNRDALVRGAIQGMVEVLKDSKDPYALFYTPRGYRSFQELTTGKFSGIGVWLKQKGDNLEIVSVLPSTPAVRAGLDRGDVIRAIDDEPVAGMTSDEAVARIKGPEGSEVTLGIERAGEPLEFTLTRAEIELPNLISKTLDEDLGLIRLFGFARGAGDQVRAELRTLMADGVKGVVLDLRDNGGGLFSEAVDVASAFIEDGEIVTYKARDEEDVIYEAEGNAFEELPLVVLVNEGTASASEIVAGALKDRDRAMLIGTTTYGKGAVQEVLPLADSSALKLTIARYFTPSGTDISGHGIRPDVLVDAEPGMQRERAIEILEGIVISASGAQG
jgi:carboxyl-terminal processing protease